jgi:hypothetical protein
MPLALISVENTIHSQSTCDVKRLALSIVRMKRFGNSVFNRRIRILGISAAPAPMIATRRRLPSRFA